MIEKKLFKFFNLQALYKRASCAKPADRMKPDPKDPNTDKDRLLKIERKSVHISADKDLQCKAASTDAWAANRVLETEAVA